ncbi:MAG: HAMP domain-containing histidine kinase [Clostridia bacterium]|nr:HAMP domain-containing histidine kinase [Clostridia bacterium]
MINKLRKRFILIAMCSIILVLVIIMGAINIASYREISSSADFVLELLAENGGDFPQAENPLQHDGKPNEAMPGITEETPYETRFFMIEADAEGNIINSNTRSIAAINEETAENYASTVLGSGREKGYLDNYRYLVTKSDSGSMIIFLDRTREITSFKNFLAISGLVSLIGIAAVFMLVLIFSKKAIKPIADSYEKQKRFITDAGHELKTPLTIIDASNEVLELEQGECQWTKSIRNQVRRLAELTESLVSLSRMDESDNALNMVDFSLSDAVSETAETFVAPAMTSGKTIEIDVEQNISYSGDESAIRRLVSILADNAIKYSSAGAKITISLKKPGKYALITCKNPVDSVDKGDLDILFERFYRGDASRAQQTTGYGIGLSMARAIAAAHKGKISARSDDGASVVVTAQL